MEEESLSKESHAGDVGPPATKYHAVNINREEELSKAQDVDPDDVTSSKLVADVPLLKTRNAPLVLSTWNVRTLLQLGKLDNLIQETEQIGMDVVGVSETHWMGSDKIVKDDYTFIYSGGQKHQHGVGILMKNRIAKTMMGFLPVNERILLCKLQARPFNIVIIQVYAPTCDHSDEEVDRFYEDLETTLKQTKSRDIKIVMGDFNAKVGNTTISQYVGKYGLGETNDRGKRLIQFCEGNHLYVANTGFKQPKRRLYTWKSPGDVCRNQIDYILVSARVKNSITKCKTYPGADIGSDHVPVVMKMKIKLKIPKSKLQKTTRYNTTVLKEEGMREKYAVEVKNRYEVLMNMEEEKATTKEETVDKQWESIKKAISEANEAMIPQKEKETKQPWMTEEILEMMKTRKQTKGTTRYKEIDKEIKKKCVEAKEEWLNQKCAKIEELSKENNLAPMYEEIKKFTKTNTATSGCIKDKSGNILFETEEICRRWTEYVEELFQDNRGENPIQGHLGGPTIMNIEVETALNSMKTGKACGIDNISTEMLKALSDFGVYTLTEFCNRMYETAYIPEELKTSVFILLPKKSKALECSDYRTISLMCHMLKLLLTVILRRIREKLDAQVGEQQAGFRGNSGTREAIFNLKILSEKCIEVGKDVYACFIDYSKAFDTVSHEKLIETLEKTGIDENDIAIIANLYWQQKTQIKIGTNLTEPVKIKRGVRQGCVLSPSLFNIYTDHIFREIETDGDEERMPGIVVGGHNINNLRYADDTVLLADCEEDLQSLVTVIKEESRKYGLEINKKKTKTMVISKATKAPEVDIEIEGEKLEQVNSFTYLGQLITEDGRSETEIKRRIGISKTIFESKKKLLTSRKLSYKLKLRLTKCFIWSVLLYASETWTLTATLEKRLEAAEMWMYRRITRTSWKDKKTNREVLNQLDLKGTSIVKTIKKRKLAYYGHIRRHDTLQRKILEGKIEGKRTKGRRRKSWIENIEETTGMKINMCCTVARDRERWRSMASNLLKEKEPR